MSILLIPIAPLSRTKSRLRDCFSKQNLKKLTIAMFKDLGDTLSKVDCYDYKVVYSNDDEILDLAETYALIGIKEILTTPRKSFDMVINDLNEIAINEFNAYSTVFTFLDTILISKQNFDDINCLMNENKLVLCPSIHSGGISVLGRSPPDVIPTYFSDPIVPSFIAQIKSARRLKIQEIAIYDSFRAGFDIDIKQDLILAHEYLKIFKLTNSYTYRFLKENLKLSLRKCNNNNNREFQFIDN